MFNRLKAVSKIYANNKFKPDFINCNIDLKYFVFINPDNANDLLLFLKDNSRYLYFIDRAEMFLTKEMISLINNSNSTFIIFARNIPGLKCRPSSYCYLKSREEEGRYKFSLGSMFR